MTDFEDIVENLVEGQFLGDGSPELGGTALKASILDNPGWDGLASPGECEIPTAHLMVMLFGGPKVVSMQLYSGNVNLGVGQYQNLREGRSVRCIQVREGCNDPSASNYSPFCGHIHP